MTGSVLQSLLNKKDAETKKIRHREMLPWKMRCMDFMQETTLPIQMERQALFIKLEARFEERPLPRVSIIDMREQLKKWKPALPSVWN